MTAPDHTLRRVAFVAPVLGAGAAALVVAALAALGERSVFPLTLAAALVLTYGAGETRSPGVMALLPLCAGSALLLQPLPGISLLIVGFLVQGAVDAVREGAPMARNWAAAVAVPALLALLVSQTI